LKAYCADFHFFDRQPEVVQLKLTKGILSFPVKYRQKILADGNQSSEFLTGAMRRGADVQVCPHGLHTARLWHTRIEEASIALGGSDG
jgi:hypothetical protein